MMPKPSKKTSEKLSEVLFNVYFLRLFKLGEVEFYAPSQVDELELGYDASFTGKSSVWEVILQFKQPVMRSDNGFTIKVDKNQLEKLHDIKAGHVFYAAPIHRDYKEVANLQLRTIVDPCDFLNTYILIDVASLPANTATIRYDRIRYRSFYTPNNPRYRSVADSWRESDHTSIEYAQVCAFARMFSQRRIGAGVALGNTNQPSRYINIDDDALLRESGSQRSLISRLSSLISAKELTVIMRLNQD